MTSSGLSVPQGTALTLGAVLGTGVISLPALAAAEAGPASLVAWAVMLVISVPLAATFAALGARHPDGGGVSTYVRLAFGDRASTMLGWAFYLTIPVGAPVASGFAGAYVADAVGGGHGTALATTAGLVVVVVAMNWMGIHVSARVQLGIAGVIAVLLLLAIVVSLPHASLDRLTPFAPFGWGAVGSAAAMLVWAFAGWEVISSLSGEYRDPVRDIARATVITLAVVAVLYLGIAFVTVAALGPAAGPAPLSDLLVLGFGQGARPVMTVVAVLLTVGTMNAYFAGTARLGAALARDGSLPAWLAHGTVAGQTPRRSLLLTGVLALTTVAALAATGRPTDTTLLLTTGTFTLVYLLGTAAAVRLLTGAGRACAVVSLAASGALVLLTGLPVLLPLALAAAGLVWSLTRPRADAPAPAVPVGSTR